MIILVVFICIRSVNRFVYARGEEIIDHAQLCLNEQLNLSLLQFACASMYNTVLVSFLQTRYTVVKLVVLVTIVKRKREGEFVRNLVVIEL